MKNAEVILTFFFFFGQVSIVFWCNYPSQVINIFLFVKLYFNLVITVLPSGKSMHICVIDVALNPLADADTLSI